jgi:hypothetical protein
MVIEEGAVLRSKVKGVKSTNRSSRFLRYSVPNGPSWTNSCLGQFYDPVAAREVNPKSRNHDLQLSV